MAKKENEEGGFGKEYDPSQFDEPAKETSGGSRVFLYVGLSVVALALVVGGIWYAGGMKGDAANQLTGTTIQAYCVDSDGGYNRFTRGITAGTYYLDYEVGEYQDECSGKENKLTEYYCKNDLVVYTTETCPEGMACADGICVK